MPLTATQVTPLNGRVLVEKVGELGRRQSPLWIAPDAKETVWEGIVLAVPKSPGALALCDVRTGDRVIYGKYAGRRVQLEGKEYIMMLEDSILGILTDSPGGATDGTHAQQTDQAAEAR